MKANGVYEDKTLPQAQQLRYSDNNVREPCENVQLEDDGSKTKDSAYLTVSDRGCNQPATL